MLYLYRRSQRDSGGPGEFRGGNGVEYALVGHKAQKFGTQLAGTHPALNTAPGLAGGYPGHQGRWLGAAQTPIRSLLRSGELPATRQALAAACGGLRDLANGERFDPGSDGVLVVQRTAGGGFGDPLHRDPRAVAADVLDDAISAAAALADYGVVLDSRGAVDQPATEAARNSRRAQRLARAAPPLTSPAAVPGERRDRRRVTDAVALVEYAAGPVWSCEHCGHLLSDGREGYRAGAASWQSVPCDVDPERYPDPRPHTDRDVVLREWYCPSCGSLLAVDACLADDPPSVDVSLAGDAPTGGTR
jgi:N-methylhydantoinase B